MLRIASLIAMAMMFAVSLGGTVGAQGQPPPGLTACSSASLSVSNTSANVQLSGCGPTVIIWNIGSQEAFIAVGATSAAAATTSGQSIPGNTGTAINVGLSQPYLAAITSTSTTTLRITQGYGFPVLGATGGGGSIIGGTTPVAGVCPSGEFIYNNSGVVGCSASSATVAFPQAVTGGTSGGIPYFSNTTTLSASALLAANAIVVGGGSGTAPSTDANATLSAGTLSLGASGTLGSIILGNATSGTLALQPVTGALGTVTALFPAASDTIVELTQTQTLTNKTLTSPVISGGTINNAVIGGTTPAAATFTTIAGGSSLTLGAQQTTQGSIVLDNTASGAFATTIKSSNSASAAWTMTLPTTAGTNLYVLQTDGSGNTSWVAQSGGGGSPGGSTNAIQYNAGSSTFGGIALGAGTILLGNAAVPTALTLGTGVSTALGTAIGSANGFAGVSTAQTFTLGQTINISTGALLTLNEATGADIVMTGTMFPAIEAPTIDFTTTSSNSGAYLFAQPGSLEILNADAAVVILSDPATAHLQFGAADAAAPVAQTLSFQSVVAGTSNTAGSNATIIGSLSTGSGASGDMIFQTGGTGAAATVQNSAVTGLTIKGATQIVQINAIASDVGQTDRTVCEDTTAHGLYSGSGTIGICLGTSSARYKHDISDLDEGLTQIMDLQPKRYFLDAAHGDPTKPYYGFIAEQGDHVLPELTGLDDEGRPNTFDYLGIVPVLVKAMQQQQAEIDQLKRKVH